MDHTKSEVHKSVVVRFCDKQKKQRGEPFILNTDIRHCLLNLDDKT